MTLTSSLVCTSDRNRFSYWLGSNKTPRSSRRRAAGHGVPGSPILPVGLGEWFLDIPADKQYNVNPDKARAVLEAAGHFDLARRAGASEEQVNASWHLPRAPEP